MLVRDPDKVYGEQFFFTYTAEAFEAQIVDVKAGEEADKARLAAEEEVRYDAVRWFKRHHVCGDVVLYWPSADTR